MGCGLNCCDPGLPWFRCGAGLAGMQFALNAQSCSSLSEMMCSAPVTGHRAPPRSQCPAIWAHPSGQTRTVAAPPLQGVPALGSAHYKVASVRVVGNQPSTLSPASCPPGRRRRGQLPPGWGGSGPGTDGRGPILGLWSALVGRGSKKSGMGGGVCQ